MSMSPISITLILALALAAPAAGSAMDKEPAPREKQSAVTVGKFLAALAQEVDPSFPADSSPAQAAAFLTEAGLSLPEKLEPERLFTEGDAVRLAESVGLRFLSLNTAHPLPADNLDPLVDLLAEALSTR